MTYEQTVNEAIVKLARYTRMIDPIADVEDAAIDDRKGFAMHSILLYVSEFSSIVLW